MKAGAKQSTSANDLCGVKAEEADPIPFPCHNGTTCLPRRHFAFFVPSGIITMRFIFMHPSKRHLGPCRAHALQNRVPSLNGVLASPLPSCCLIPSTVGLVHVRNLGHQGVIRVRVCEHGADGEQDCDRKLVSSVQVSSVYLVERTNLLRWSRRGSIGP